VLTALWLGVLMFAEVPLPVRDAALVSERLIWSLIAKAMVAGWQTRMAERLSKVR
jgi:hypothetical protein